MSWIADVMNWFADFSRTDWLIICLFVYHVLANHERARASWQRYKLIAAKLEIHDADINSGRFGQWLPFRNVSANQDGS